MKAVQLLVNSALPEDLRSGDRPLDSRDMQRIMAGVAKNHPDRYAEIAQKLSDIGRRASWSTGETVTMEDLRPSKAKAKLLDSMNKELAAARKSLGRAEYEKEREDIWLRYSDEMEKLVMAEALASNNSLALAAGSGARGKPAQIKALLGGAGVYQDSEGRVVPMFIGRSFVEGVRPAELMAGTFGARASVVASKKSTAQAGDWGKQGVVNAADLVVTDEDCGAEDGLPWEVGSEGLRGRVLAREAGGVPAGTLVDKQVEAKLKRAGVGNVLVRSPITCHSKHGVCAKCAGAGPGGELPRVGDAVGVTGASALAEPIAQAGLNTKHLSGQAKGRREYAGFEWLNQFTQVPEEFRDAAALSRDEGRVEEIREAEQGGHYVKVAGKDYYVPPNLEVDVEEGQSVEPGDALSSGLPNPAEVVELRGLGEGRRYYAQRLKKILDDSGQHASPVNVELLARASVRHVLADDPPENSRWLPDDLIDYQELEADYEPPEEAYETHPDQAHGLWLERPVMHYTIGTRLTPRMTAEMKDNGVDKVLVSGKKPWFKPYMSRMRTANRSGGDWLAAMHGSYLKERLVHGAERGQDTDVASNRHFAPRLAIGVGFGDNARATGEF